MTALRLLALTMLVASPAYAKPPRLTLLLTVEGMNSELLLRMRPRLKGGLGQLMNQGALCPTLRQTHAESATTPNLATLVTGALPSAHGAVSNRVFHRGTGRDEALLGDANHPVLEAPLGADDTSPANLDAETLSDRLRLSTQGKGKSVAVAVQARSAILLAGHLGQAWWLSEPFGRFVTGTYYRKEFPDWVKAFNDKKLPESYFGKEWGLLAPAKEYVGDDDRPFETELLGLGRTFPKALNGGLPGPGPQALVAFAATPMVNDVLVQLGRAALDGEALGKDDVPDLLSVGFGALGPIARAYGPYSWEMQDAVLRLDKALAELVQAAERAAGGRTNLLIVFTSVHGSPALPEAWTVAGMNAERLAVAPLVTALNRELKGRFDGAEPLVAGIEGVDVYLNPKLLAARKLDATAVRRAAAQWLHRQSQVEVAVARDDLFTASDPTGLLEPLRAGYHSWRSGDVLFVPKPFRVPVDEKGLTFPSTPYTYDAELPLVLAGRGTGSGVKLRPAHLTDVAATVAALLETGSPALSRGEVLTELLSGK